MCFKTHAVTDGGLHSIINGYGLLKTNKQPVPYPEELTNQVLILQPKYPVNDHFNVSSQLGVSSARRGVLQLLLKTARFVLVYGSVGR